MIIFELMVMMIRTMRHFDALLFQRNPLHVTLKKLNSLQKLTYWIDDVRHIQIAGCHLVEHGCEEKEIVMIHQSDFHIGISRNRTFDFQCGIEAAEPATKNDNACFHSSATSQKILMAPLA